MVFGLCATSTCTEGLSRPTERRRHDRTNHTWTPSCSSAQQTRPVSNVEDMF